MPAHAHRLVAILVIAVAVSLAAMLPGLITGQQGGADEQSSDVNDIDLLVTVEQSSRYALPGDQVEYTATIENNTGEPQTNLEAIMVVTEQADAMTYVEDSTFIRYREDGPEFPLPPLSRQTTLLAETIEPAQIIQVRWSLEVGRCALRNDWAQVVFRVRTDDLEPPYPDSNLYIVPHTDVWVLKHFSVGYEVDTLTPAPGEAVRHTVRVVNDGGIILDDVTVHLWYDESRDRILPTVSEDSTFTILSGRDGRPGRIVPVDPKWSTRLGRLLLDYLNPGNILVLSWTDYVADDAPIGTVVTPQVGVRVASSTEWTDRTARITVAPPRDDFSVEIKQDDAGYVSSARFPGDPVNMRVTISNYTDVPRPGVSVSLDLPTALSYVSGSGAYSTAAYVAGNSRRLPDDWIDDGIQLPTIAPGEETTITFRALIGDDISPQDGIDVYAVLRSPTDVESRTHARIDVVKKPDIDLSLRDLRAAEAGSVVWFDATIQNSGQAPLTDVKFGFEQPCPSIMAYIPGTLYVDSQTFVLRDDASVLSQQERGEDVSIELGDLKPGEKIGIAMRFRLADDVEPGTVAGPHLRVTARSTDRRLVPDVGAGTPTEITVAQPSFVTKETFEARVEQLLGEIEKGATKTAENTDRILALAETAREINEEIKDITTATGATATELEETSSAIRANTDAIGEATETVGKTAEQIEDVATETDATTKRTEDLATKIGETSERTIELVAETKVLTGRIQANTNAVKKTTEAIEEQADVILKQVREVNPWSLGWKWVLLWGGFGVVASFIAGAVLPGTFWRLCVWVGGHWGGSGFPGPPTPSSWGRPIMWATDRWRAGATLLATARRRVRDWIDGLWRR